MADKEKIGKVIDDLADAMAATVVAKTENKEQKVAEDQKMKELAFRLLWQCSRIVKGATSMELQHEMNRIREWVGAERSNALETSWRLGKPIE